MAKNKTEGKLTRLQWTVRILILVIFVVALLIAAGRLMEWNREQQRLAEEQRKKEELEEQIGDLEGEIDRTVDEDYVKDHTGTVSP